MKVLIMATPVITSLVTVGQELGLLSAPTMSGATYRMYAALAALRIGLEMIVCLFRKPRAPRVPQPMHGPVPPFHVPVGKPEAPRTCTVPGGCWGTSLESSVWRRGGEGVLCCRCVRQRERRRGQRRGRVVGENVLARCRQVRETICLIRR